MRVLTGPHTHSAEIKKSRFLATAVPIATPQEALVRLASLRDPGATHNCWAYRVGSQYRFSDDGEPGGTAGRPILAAIEGQEIDAVLVVVTRFFGGIKLGAGGLVRAYGGTAAECLRTAPQQELRPRTTLCVQLPFDAVGALYPLLEKHSVEKRSEEHGADGTTFLLRLDEADAPDFRQALADATRGQAVIQAVIQAVEPAPTCTDSSCS
ncbi:MAG: YigZ family protein [bacterium]